MGCKIYKARSLELQLSTWKKTMIQVCEFSKYLLKVRKDQTGLPWWLSGKESACQCRRFGFDSWVRKIPWRRKWQPTPVFLPGKFHGQKSLASYSPWGCKRVWHVLATKQTKNKNKKRTNLVDTSMDIKWIRHIQGHREWRKRGEIIFLKWLLYGSHFTSFNH